MLRDTSGQFTHSYGKDDDFLLSYFRLQFGDEGRLPEPEILWCRPFMLADREA